MAGEKRATTSREARAYIPEGIFDQIIWMMGQEGWGSSSDFFKVLIILGFQQYCTNRRFLPGVSELESNKEPEDSSTKSF